MAGSIKVVFDSKGIGEKFRSRAKNFSERQTTAIQTASRRAADEIENEGRASMRAGGNFGSARWQEGLQCKVSYQSRNDIRIRLTHSTFFWRVFVIALSGVPDQPVGKGRWERRGSGDRCTPPP